MPTEEERQKQREALTSFVNDLIAVAIGSYDTELKDGLKKGEIKVRVRKKRPSEIVADYNKLQKESDAEAEARKREEAETPTTEPKSKKKVEEPKKKSGLDDILDSIFPF